MQTQTQTQKPREFGFLEKRQLQGTLLIKYKDKGKYKHKYKDKDKHENHESLCSVKTGGSWGSSSLNTTSTKTNTNAKINRIWIPRKQVARGDPPLHWGQLVPRVIFWFPALPAPYYCHRCLFLPRQ